MHFFINLTIIGSACRYLVHKTPLGSDTWIFFDFPKKGKIGFSGLTNLFFNLFESKTMKADYHEQAILWSLAKSLETAEKNHFLKKYKIRLPDRSYPLYIQLFEWICAHETPNEKALLAALGPALTKKNLSYTRHYLQNQLIETLGQLEEKRNEQAALIHNVPVIRKLFQRGQQAMATKLWKQALRQAAKLEDYVLVKLLKDEYLSFALYYDKTNKYGDLLEIYNTSIADTEAYFQATQLEALCLKSILIRKKTHFNLSADLIRQIQQLEAHPLLQEQPPTSAFLCYHYWSLTNGIIRYLQSDFEGAVAYITPLVSHWHNRPEQISYRPETYLEVLYIFTYAAMHLRRFNEIEAIYLHSANRQIQDRYNSCYFSVLKYLSFLRIRHKTGDYTAVARLLKEIIPQIPQWMEDLSPDLQRSLLMSASISCFVLDDAKNAGAYARQTLLLFNNNMRPDQAHVTHLFLLLLCYEAKHEWMFLNQFRACYQYFYRHQSFSRFEKEIMGLLKKTFPYRRNEKNLRLFKAALVQLNKNNSRIKRDVCHIFNFPGWIASRIQGIAYRDWVQQEVNRS